jgi:hypothetical protein
VYPVVVVPACSRECGAGSRYLLLDAEEEKLDPELHLALLKGRAQQHAAYAASLAALEGESSAACCNAATMACRDMKQTA